MRRTTAQRDQELDWLREELIEEVRLCWQSDDRWAPWGPPDPEEWYLPWKPKDRLTLLCRLAYPTITDAKLDELLGAEAPARIYEVLHGGGQ